MARLQASTRLKTLVVGTVSETAAQPEAVSSHLKAAGQSVDVA